MRFVVYQDVSFVMTGACVARGEGRVIKGLFLGINLTDKMAENLQNSVKKRSSYPNSVKLQAMDYAKKRLKKLQPGSTMLHPKKSGTGSRIWRSWSQPLGRGGGLMVRISK